MVECLNYVTFLVVMTSCLTLIVTEDRHNADAASGKSGVSHTHWTMQQQQQNPQLRQSQPRPRYPHLAADLHALLADKVDYTWYPLPKLNEHQTHLLDLASDNSIHGTEHFLSKRYDTSFLTNNEHIGPAYLTDLSPQFEDNAMFIPSSAPDLSPYLSAREFKETFRRSMPYFLGKRGRYFLPVNEMALSEDKRGAPKFIGKRESTNSGEVTDNSVGSRNYLIEYAADNDIGPFVEDNVGVAKLSNRRFTNISGPYLDIKDAEKSLGLRMASGLSSEHKRGVPKFVGRRGVPYFVGKKGAPMFLGKRLNDLHYSDEELSVNEYKRGSPKFIGKRGSLHFSAKRGAPRFIGKRMEEFSELDNENSEGKRVAPKFVGRGAAPYFVGRREAARIMGKYRASSAHGGIENPLESFTDTSVMKGEGCTRCIVDGQQQNSALKLTLTESPNTDRINSAAVTGESSKLSHKVGLYVSRLSGQVGTVPGNTETLDNSLHNIENSLPIHENMKIIIPENMSAQTKILERKSEDQFHRQLITDSAERQKQR